MAAKLGVDEKQTSSAATNYNDADGNWLMQQGTRIKQWLGFGNVDWQKGLLDIGNFFNKIARGLSPGAGGTLGIFEAAGQGIASIWNALVPKGAKEKVTNFFMAPLVKFGPKVLGKLGTPEGQALAGFAALSGGALGGATLLGVGPEVTLAMLRGAQLIYTLNWKETDEQIAQSIQGSIDNLAASAGDAVGTGLASLVTGGVFKFPRVQINVTKISILWRSLNEEAQEEMMQQLKSLARNAFFTGLRAAVKVLYRTFRSFIKQLAKTNPNHPLLKLVPGGAATIAKWGTGGEPWQLNLYVEKEIEKLQENPATKTFGLFLENALESFGDGITDFLPELVRTPIA